MRKSLFFLFLTLTPLFLNAQWSMVRFDEYNFFTKSATPDPATSIFSAMLPTANGSFIMRTNDGGLSWDSIYISSPSAVYSIKDLDFTDVNNGFAGASKNSSNQCLLKTSDNGTTWSEITPDPSQINPVNAVNFLNTLTGYVTDKTNLYKTIDGGNSWTTTVPGFGIEDIDFSDVDNGYACGQFMPNAVVMKTTDGGATWNTVMNTMVPFFTASSMQKLDVISADIVYVSAQYSNILYRTLNGGLSWDTLTISQIFNLEDYDFISATEGHILSSMGEIFGTVDGGQTWTLEYAVAGGSYGPSVFLTSISFSGNTGYVCGSNGLIKKYTVPTGLQQTNDNLFSISPNPVRSGEIMKLTGLKEKFSLKVYTLTGNCVMNNEYENEQQVTLPLVSGNYLVEIISGDAVLHEKIIVIN